MPVKKTKRITFADKPPLTPEELVAVLSGSYHQPWFRAILQVIRDQKSDSMDLIGTSLGLNNPLAAAHGAGGMDFADNLIVSIHELCAPKPE